MRLRAIAVLCAVLLVCPVCSAGVQKLPGLEAPQEFTPEFLRESCYKYGAVNTVRLLTAPGSTLWSELLGHIASGDVNWIIYVPLFASGTDAGYATQLTIALAEALPKNPHAVLSLEYSFLSLRNVCSLPFFNPDEAFIKRYTQDVFESMKDITDPYMQMDKDICMTRLKNATHTAQKRLDSARQGSAK